jgi:hypothetical protein
MRKNTEAYIEIYILCLFKFRDDKIVFSREELEKLSRALNKHLHSLGYANEENPEKINDWYITHLRNENLGFRSYSHLEKAQLGYYHHRIIACYTLRIPDLDFYELREIRQELKDTSDRIIRECVNIMNNSLDLLQISEKAAILYFYTYPFIVVISNRRRHETIPFSQETGTLSFDFFEPWHVIFQKEYVMRISGPGTILNVKRWTIKAWLRGFAYRVNKYCQEVFLSQALNGFQDIIYRLTEEETDQRLIRDIINTIYQYCLYEKKLIDENKGTRENRLDESVLVNLWDHIVSTMGGRPVDILIARIAFLANILAIIAITLAILACR